MRRKKLLLVVLAAFFLSGYGALSLLQNLDLKPEMVYIQIQKWGTPEEVEIPKTGSELLNVISPSVVAEMAWPSAMEENIIQDSTSEPLHIKSEVIETVHHLTLSEICGEVILGILGIGVIILLGYLTYQHFMR